MGKNDGMSDDTASGDSGSDEGTRNEELDSGEEGGIGDDRLPEDLQPTSDNPLARHPGQTGEDEDMIGGASDEERARNPSASMGYGSAGSDSEDSSEAENSSDGNSED